jgi:uncharacterized membrane protein required for colicin V production
MGLDLVLGGLVLVTAIRGWLKGFVLQAIRLAGLVACVYLADPVRDQARPYVLVYVPKIRPDLVDRLLWWSSAVASYVVLVGLVTLAVKLYRPQPIRLAEPNRNDQFAGFLLGGVKGALIALFLVAGLQKYALERIKALPWADEQARASWVLQWNERYQPAARIWASRPVQQFVSRVQRRGLMSPSDVSPISAEPKPVQAAAGRTPRLALPSESEEESATLRAPGLDNEIARAIESIKRQLQQGEDPE